MYCKTAETIGDFLTIPLQAKKFFKFNETIIGT